ncbi:AAA family ATPase [Paenibacillus lycopersici]|uniref:AAA family ATPase n=1 Tax=Paenibacillus lycopersici TaxID=2704462 RepID=A0A6C0G159_9BACL|nr:AAA family ATPase [Paenibacillus lycopersici]QHT60949.1 AAA family ATPase [Paenibacillus lycopersici]
MFNVCPSCGEYRVDKTIRQTKDGACAICPSCNHPHPFLRLPLFVVTGASGTGKSTLALQLSNLTKDVVVMETDILWDNRYNEPETNYRAYREMWLRTAKNIAQAGKPVVLCGTAMPDQLENCEERRYFEAIHYIALVCESRLLEERLKRRPSWRASGSDEFVQAMVGYNQWLIGHGPANTPAIATLDTSMDSTEESARKALAVISAAMMQS